MSEAVVHQGVTAGPYEPSLFGTYSKKIGMWLFLLSDSLTFGALLYAYSYGRISTPNWPTPFLWLRLTILQFGRHKHKQGLLRPGSI